MSIIPIILKKKRMLQGSKLNYLVLPADYWQEEETENYFIEEETSIILTLEDI